MPLVRRIPKRGFNNAAFKITYAPVNLQDLELLFHPGQIDEKALREKRLVNGKWDGVKILGTGDVTKKFFLTVDAISASAREKIERAGGTVDLVPPKYYPDRNSAKLLRRTSLPPRFKFPSLPERPKKAEAVFLPTPPEASTKPDRYAPYTRERVKAAQATLRHRVKAINCELSAKMRETLSALGANDPLPALILDHNIHGIGFGKKWVKGVATEQNALRFYVFTKVSQSRLPAHALIPNEVNGIATDVIAMPPPQLLDGPIPSAATPLAGISKVSNPAGQPGTLGAYCKSTRPGEENKQFLLSCMHVIFADSTNAEIHHADISPTEHIAMRKRKVEPGHDNILSADAAIAEVLPVNSARMTSSVCHLSPKNVAAAEDDSDLDYPVEKNGAATGLTRGLVVDIDFNSRVAFKQNELMLQDQIVVWSATRICDNGDSGALLVRSDTKHVVGICYAGQSVSASRNQSREKLDWADDYTFGEVIIASPLKNVFSELEVTF
jgi:hypothetical protein